MTTTSTKRKTVVSTSTEVEQDTRFFGHPRGLANLFGVEMWERFSFYGMLGILAIYLYHSVTEGALGLPQAPALGVVVGPLLTGLAQQEVSFHLGFGLAAIGMALGLIQYTIGRKNLPDKASEVPNPLPGSQRLPVVGAAVLVIAAIVALILTGVVRPDNLADIVVWLVAVISVIYFVVILSSRKITTDERSRVFSFIPMFIASVAFWSLYQQQFTVVTAYS